MPLPYRSRRKRRRRWKPPQRREVCGFSIYYKGALVREYYGKELIKEFEKTCAEKELLEKR